MKHENILEQNKLQTIQDQIGQFDSEHLEYETMLRADSLKL